MPRLPSLFISHGSPMLALQATPAHHFLAGLGASLPTPTAIAVVSAHWESVGGPAVSLAAQPDTIHDFGGFPRALFEIAYPAPGAPDVAARTVALLEQAGYAVKASTTRGLDHGAWVPLRLMYPDAAIPVFQVAILRGATPEAHLKLGQALGALRDEGVLVIGSGSLTHNLGEVWGKPLDAPVPDWVSAFGDWMQDKLAKNDTAALLDYRRQAPHAERNHPTDEHLAPLFVAMGAAGEHRRAERLHASHEYGVLAMDMVAFS